MFRKLFKKNIPDKEQFLQEILKKDADIKLLAQLLENKKVDINEINEDGDSYLHICLKNKKNQNALWLISRGIKVDTLDPMDKSPFDLAIANQSHKVVKQLLTKVKVDLNKTNEFGRTYLQDSVILGDHAMAKLLIENGADINIKNNKNRNVFYDALSYNNDSFIEYLLNFDELELNELDSEKSTYFDHKSVKHNKDLALKLIERGADPTIQSQKGKSFLYHCAIDGYDGLEIIKFALENGHDINSKVRENDNMTIVMVDELLALKNPEDEDKKKTIRFMLKDLMENGLDVNAKTEDGETALFKAVRANDEDLVHFLLSLDINVNIQSNDKHTALANAVYQGTGSLKIIVDLLKNHADPTLRNSEDKSLFEEINDIILDIRYPAQLQNKENINAQQLSRQYESILKELLKHCKKDLNFLDSNGNPLFYKPIMYHNIPLFYLYTSKGLNIHKLNKNGHNLFFEYLMKVFEDNNEDIEFQGVLNILIGARIDHNRQDETGWTAVSKVIATTQCNLNLFKILIKVVKFDYTITDKLGRTAIHSAVWKGNKNIIRIINFIDSNIKNIPDNYGILPITYAALLGNQDLVLTFAEMKAKTTADCYIIPAAVKKFTPMLANLSKLTQNTNDPMKLKHLHDVVAHVKADFDLTAREADVSTLK